MAICNEEARKCEEDGPPIGRNTGASRRPPGPVGSGNTRRRAPRERDAASGSGVFSARNRRPAGLPAGGGEAAWLNAAIPVNRWRASYCAGWRRERPWRSTASASSTRTHGADSASCRGRCRRSSSPTARRMSHWPRAIEAAIESSDFFVACFSGNSVRKKGGFQSELRYALDCARQVPLDEIYIVPVRLDECPVPRTIQHELQYIDLFPDWDGGMERLLTMLRREVERRRPAV